MSGQYRPLTKSEISQLEQQHCSCSDWSNVQVGQSFKPGYINNARFSGRVRIGNNVRIASIHNYIANYEIGDDVVIENVGVLAVSGKSSFGNGTRVAVINEAGGREVPIYDNLSAQIAALLALYRHRPGLVEKLNRLIDNYAKMVSSDIGTIGAGASIKNAAIITNVKFGPAAVIDGALRLENGSVNSAPEDPAYIGTGVYAKNFITSSGSHLDNGAILQNCFVGQASRIERQFCAENCLFFANCIAAHGEACSVFAGPYTTTHHKSTLLIAGMFSFFNAGSGTNQSNHLYKLGPVHQGICERGCKTGSNAYLIWPARIGAFSTIIGSHYTHFDTSSMPFSYLIEEKGNTVLVPAAVFKTIGIVRDEHKWQQRDNRKDPHQLDLIIFDALSPYTVQNIISGRNQLGNIQTALKNSTPESIMWNNLTIKLPALAKAVSYYELALARYLGKKVISRIAGSDIAQLRNVLRPMNALGRGRWVDLAGLIISEEAVLNIVSAVENGATATLDALADSFKAFYENYNAHEWCWAASLLEDTLATNIDKMLPDDIIRILQEYKSAVEKLNTMMLDDARKEFDDSAKISYGHDGEPAVRDADFEAVRGKFEDNEFIKHLSKITAERILEADKLIGKLKTLR